MCIRDRSICAADQRYYTGSRGRVVMKQKLPMALIHEAVGEVVYDPKGEYQIGTNVVMVPNTPCLLYTSRRSCGNFRNKWFWKVNNVACFIRDKWD